MHVHRSYFIIRVSAQDATQTQQELPAETSTAITEKGKAKEAKLSLIITFITNKFTFFILLLGCYICNSLITIYSIIYNIYNIYIIYK
jgi:hypothetical protein